MLKKLTAFFLSLLVCLSLLPGQTCATDAPDPVDPLAVVEPADPETPAEPDASVCSAPGDVPLDDDDYA